MTGSFSRYQKLVVALLAFLQFTVILDFMTLSPLGAILMPTLHITPKQFGLVVSVYAFSAGISGLLAAGFADRFDRKPFLLFFYSGFVLGTFFCAIANSYTFLLVARMVTGVFGGVISSIVLAIATDLFPLEIRGRVMGFVQTAYAASQVLGIPAGLYLSNAWGWHAPFFMIVVVSLVVGVLILVRLQPINSHLAMERPGSALAHLRATVTTPRYLQAFMTTILLSTGSFMLLPFSSAFTVHNMGIDITDLPIIYLVAGLCSLVMGPLAGRAADSVGKFKTFVFGSSVDIVLLLIYTHLGKTPLLLVIFVTVFMFIGVSSRTVSAQALISAIPSADSRGAFMSINSSVRQISGGLACVLAGFIVVEGDNGALLHVDFLGVVVASTFLFALLMMNRIRRFVPERSKPANELQMVFVPNSTAALLNNGDG